MIIFNKVNSISCRTLIVDIGKDEEVNMYELWICTEEQNAWKIKLR